MEVNFCRRCGAPLTKRAAHMFVCTNQHTLYANSSPAVAIILLNDTDEVLTIRRAIEPGLGELDFPGGFCDHHETAEEALARETTEEVGLRPEHYSTPELICTGIDHYNFDGETIPVFSLIYTATVTDGAPITAGDDAEHAKFLPLKSIDPKRVFFESLQHAITILQNRRVKA